MYRNSDSTQASVEYFERHRCALLKLHKNLKRPVGNGWQLAASRNTLQWRLWRAEGFNLGVHAGESGLIIVDLDPAGETGDPNVWANWEKWCKDNGLQVYLPHAVSPSGGWHLYFRIPVGTVVRKPREKLGAGIDVLVGNKQSVAPGSYYDGSEGKVPGWYKFYGEPRAPYDAPQALLDACTSAPRKPTKPDAQPAATKPALENYPIGKVAKWIERKLPKWQEESDPNPWNDQGEWVFFGKALKLHFPNEDGLALLMQVTYDGHDTIERRWWDDRDFKVEYFEGARTLKYCLDRDIDWMFMDVVIDGTYVPPPPLTPEDIAKNIEDMIARRMPLPVGYAAAVINYGVPQPEWWERYVAAGPVQEDPEPKEYDNVIAGVTLDDFVAYSPLHKYFYTPTRELWLAVSVDSRVSPVPLFDKDGEPILAEKTGKQVKISAASWLDQNHAAEQVTWCPGLPMEVKDKLVNDGGWFEKPGACTFNLYKASTIELREGDASPWIDHVRRVFPDDAEHIIAWLAQRVQRPYEKINHALVLGGKQGVGKDTILEPIKAAIGAWNFKEVNPKQLLGRFNGFIKSVILRVSEARDLGEIDRYGFYEATKTLAAAPPDTLRVDEKHLPEQAVFNVTGVIITTNNKDGLYVPSDDRRYFVAWSPLSKEDFRPAYWTTLYSWFERGGNEIVAHYLATKDLSGFDPKAPPPKTPAFWEIVDAGRAPEDAELADALDKLGQPKAVTLESIANVSDRAFAEWLRDRNNRRKIPHRFEACGYVPVRNSGANDGLWPVITGKRMEKDGRTVDVKKRQAVYAKRELSLRDQLAAASLTAFTPPLHQPPLPPVGCD
jgi:hypothetical protein